MSDVTAGRADCSSRVRPFEALPSTANSVKDLADEGLLTANKAAVEFFKNGDIVRLSKRATEPCRFGEKQTL